MTDKYFPDWTQEHNAWRRHDGWAVLMNQHYHWYAVQPDGDRMRNERNEIRTFGDPDTAKTFVDKFHPRWVQGNT